MENYEENLQKKTEIARYFVDNNSTVRETAKKFKKSKSCVHKILKEGEYLDYFIGDESLSTKVRRQLAINKAQRHIRGGEATRQKFLKNKSV